MGQNCLSSQHSNGHIVSFSESLDVMSLTCELTISNWCYPATRKTLKPRFQSFPSGEAEACCCVARLQCLACCDISHRPRKIRKSPGTWDTSNLIACTVFKIRTSLPAALGADFGVHTFHFSISFGRGPKHQHVMMVIVEQIL